MLERLDMQDIVKPIFIRLQWIIIHNFTTW